jgi:hypothetical protein
MAKHHSVLNRRRFLSHTGIAAVAAAPVMGAIARAADTPSIRGIAPTFEGTPKQIGAAYGERFKRQIGTNIDLLLSPKNVARANPDLQAWAKSQETLITRHWPWYIEEMRGVAQGAGKRYEDILLLNLRIWQFNYYGATEGSPRCTSIAVTLADGHVACAGALDDGFRNYCGPVRIVPDQGHRFISFPITGTSWCMRGLNSAGLAAGISSQLLPGLKRLKNAVMQDVAMRALLQTCGTVDEVREFCRQHPFTMNLVCVDAQGKIFCAQHTAAGLLELPANGCCVLTNHVVDDAHIDWLGQRGVNEFPPITTTRHRRGHCLKFFEEHQGRCTEDDVKKFVGTRNDALYGTIHNAGSIYITYACPQASKEIFWVMEPKAPQNNHQFRALRV